MTFVLAFYSFNLEITNSDSGVYHKARVKIPRHPQETLEQMYARVLAFTHSYEEGIEFSRGMFELREPSLWKKDVIGDIISAVEVGSVDLEKLHRALKRRPIPRYSVYFYDQAQMQKFCHGMRGSTTNWIEDIHFFWIPPTLLQAIIPLEKSSSTWSLTFVDGTLYLTVDGTALETSITTLDMWAQFQESLGTQCA